jgi:formate hydrogenlyase subunit 4
MSAVTIASGCLQIIGGLVLAPLLPGLVQRWKARLQGRPGPSPWQPFRELRRLWSKSTVSVDATTIIYRLAPATIAASLVAAVLVVPVGVHSPGWGLGHDALVLVGLLALARFAAAVSAWDTGNGFSLMGASRDLSIAVFVEMSLLLCLAAAALASGSTDLTAMIAAGAGGAIWTNALLIFAALPFAIVVIAETGRQPVDNPDTHLELTMIHEGPLLEYAGRDLAYLQWAVAARHWVVLGLAAQIFLPHFTEPWWQLATLPVSMVVLCAGLALAETLVAKMRVLLVPRLLVVSSLVVLLGVAVRLAGIA